MPTNKSTLTTVYVVQLATDCWRLGLAKEGEHWLSVAEFKTRAEAEAAGLQWAFDHSVPSDGQRLQ